LSKFESNIARPGNPACQSVGHVLTALLATTSHETPCFDDVESQLLFGVVQTLIMNSKTISKNPIFSPAAEGWCFDYAETCGFHQVYQRPIF
jgi:hypothetical protein